MTARELFIKSALIRSAIVPPLTFMVDAIIGGGSKAFAHFANIFLHMVAILLLWRLFLELGFERAKAFYLLSFFGLFLVFYGLFFFWFPHS